MASLESILKQLKAESREGKFKLLDSLDFEDHLASSDQHDPKKDPSPLPSMACLRRTNDGLISYHGPTSIYHVGSEIPPEVDELSVSNACSSPETPGPAVSKDPFIEQAVILFFRWQYPHFMFIYREAFLLDYLLNTYSGRYCTQSLLYALAALGSLGSMEASLRAMSECFFDKARVAVELELAQPHITTVQSLLCLAFYEIGRGKISQGWLLSGMAFRISQDLGLQRGLKDDSSLTVRIDHEIRGRVYWGCYTSDALISLILGRPVFFQDRDSVVDPSEPLPDNPELEAWLESGSTDYKVSKLIPYLKSLSKLGGVMHETLSRVFALKASSGDEKQGLIHQVDMDLGRWLETLPGEIRWNRWWPVTKPLEPHIAALHLTFLCVRICIHRENMVSSRDTTSARSSREHCESLIGMVVQLMRHYKSQHDLRQAPIIFVYASALALDVHGLLQRPRDSLQSSTASTDFPARVLKRDLEKCGKTWKISEEIYLKLARNESREIPDEATDEATSSAASSAQHLLHSASSDAFVEFDVQNQELSLFGFSPYQPDMETSFWDDSMFPTM